MSPVRPGWPGVRWSGREDWHVTLAFLGEVARGLLPELTTRLARAARRHHAAELSVARAGAFPAPRRATVLWAGIGGDRRALGHLAASVAAGARRAGAPSPDEGRRYRPHLTLGRSREPADLGALVGALADFAGTPWAATEIHLIHSQPGSEPRYQTLGSWPMRDPE